MTAGAAAAMLIACFKPPPALTFLQVTSDISNQTTYSFASQNFGAAHAGRYIIAAFAWAGSNPTASSCSIGGVAATKAVDVVPATSAGGASIWIAYVPTGTSGTVSITLSAGAARMGLALYAVTNLWSPIPTATSTATAAVSGSSSGSLNVLTLGVAVGVSYSVDGITGFTWTGLTEDSQALIEADNEFSSASITLPNGATPLSWSAADGSATRSPFAAVAAFR